MVSATDFCWRMISEMDEVGAYDAMCVLGFLERVPDRERAEAEFARLRDSLRAAAAIDPEAEGHVHTPLDLAPRPDSMGRGLFSDDEIDLHLDVVIDAQGEDADATPTSRCGRPWSPTNGAAPHRREPANAPGVRPHRLTRGLDPEVGQGGAPARRTGAPPFARQPFSPVCARPSTNWRCAITNTASTGSDGQRRRRELDVPHLAAVRRRCTG